MSHHWLANRIWISEWRVQNGWRCRFPRIEKGRFIIEDALSIFASRLRVRRRVWRERGRGRARVWSGWAVECMSPHNGRVLRSPRRCQPRIHKSLSDFVRSLLPSFKALRSRGQNVKWQAFSFKVWWKGCFAFWLFIIFHIQDWTEFRLFFHAFSTVWMSWEKATPFIWHIRHNFMVISALLLFIDLPYSLGEKRPLRRLRRRGWLVRQGRSLWQWCLRRAWCRCTRTCRRGTSVVVGVRWNISIPLINVDIWQYINFALSECHAYSNYSYS